MKFNKTMIALALASTLSACGSDSKKEDTTAPVITLNGDASINISVAETYEDAGASATDDVDGSVAATLSGSVDTSTAGVYTLTFTATDAAGNSSTATRTVTVVAPVETTVTGQAVKGVLANAVVTVYKFVDGEPVALDPATELKDGEITTDGSGNYFFIVLDYEGPIKVELSPSTDSENPTTMICDAPMGCGDTAFGDAIDLTAADPNFKLAAISVVDSESTGEVKVNISALTHLAAALIEEDDGGVTADTVTEQSTLIASTFGIEGDITQLEATVTTDAQAVAGEDNAEELRLGLINAGIMAAMFSGETDDTDVLSTKLAEIAVDLIENDGALLVNQDEEMDGFELAISDVLEGAADAASAASDEIAADENLTSIIDVAQEETNLANEQAYQEANVGDDGLSEVVIDEPTEGDAVAKAKAMVNDVRVFTHLFDETTTEGAGVKTQGDEYLALMDAAGVMITTEADSFTLLAQVSEALAELSMAYDEGTISEELAAAGINIATYITGATGSITFDENTATGGVLFNVDVTSGNEVVTLNASAEFEDDGLSIVLKFDGSVESAGAKFTLSDSSFAQINLDTAASRTAFEEDTYNGEIVSGELKLELILEQKASDTVTNPITFIGMLHTKLLPVGERVLDERWTSNDSGEQYIEGYGRPEIDTFVLPEMLTLSGEFSSFEQDSIKATLTVNVNNLDSHEAPEFKYIGKEVADIVNITFSDDLNTVVITEADSVSDKEQAVETRIFTPGTQVGEWMATSSVVATNSDEHYWGTGIERKITTNIDNEGVLQYTRAYILGNETAGFGFKSIRITPIDHDENGTTDAYQFEAINNKDDKSYDGSSFAKLMDDNGNVLTSDGELHPWDTSWSLGEYASIDEFLEYNSTQLIANPLTVSNGAELLAQTISNWWGNQRSLHVEELGRVTFFFNDEELENIAAGELPELNPTAYLTQPLIKDAVTIEVSADANTLTDSFEGAYTATYTFSGEAGSDFNSDEVKIDEHNGTSTESIWSRVTDSGLDVSQVIVSRMAQGPWGEVNSQLKFMPVDDQVDGEVGFGVADRIEVYYVGGFNTGHGFNNNGDLVDANGIVVDIDVSGWMITQFDSYDNFDWTSASWGTMNSGWNPLPFNPLTVSNAIEVYQGFISNDENHYSSFSYYLDDIGKVETDFDEDTLDAITANSTTMFDVINTEADSRNSFEDEETFLQGNAALTLEAILGDYQVKVQFSGDRTALEAGAFDLDMSYRLPSADTQRSFAVHYNTEVEGRLTANNADGVVLVLNEPDEDATGTQILGHILVGPTAIVAATIEDRGNGLVVIVYSDETTETL